MDRAKVKNLILIILLLLNLFLLILVLLDVNESRSVRQEAERTVHLVLENAGIDVPETVSFSETIPAAVSLHRDLDAETNMVEAVLGRCTVEDAGGNIYSYSGQHGKANFRGTGEFEIVLDSGAVPTGSDPVETAADVLSAMGIESYLPSAAVTRSSDAIEVELSCAWQGSEIYNCTVSFTFSQESLILIMGQRFFDTEGETSVQGNLDAATAVMRLLEILKEEEMSCSAITEVEPGYVLVVSVSGDSNLNPYWRIATDVGNYYISAVTGRQETVPL